MINKKLLSFDRKALHYVGLNVLFQWLGMLCNVVLVMTPHRRRVCGQPDRQCPLAGDAALPADCAGALWPYPLRLRYERPGFQGCQAHPAPQHLCKAHPAGGRLQRDGGHQ